ncbi:MAG: sensor histidine kinase, partial [Candidatus Ornithomonoglobus sp.]
VVSVTILLTLLGGGKLIDFCVRLAGYAICIAAEWLFVRKNCAKLNYLPDKNWCILSFVPLGFTILIFVIALYPVHFSQSATNIMYIYLIAAVMLLVYVVIFHTLISQYNLQNAEHANSILISQLRSVEKQFDTISETEEQLNIYRHDMRFYLASITEMLKDGNTERALGFIGGVDRKLAQSKYKVYCQDKTINAALSYYIEKAEENGIKTEISFTPPDKLAIDTIDFAVMLSNALDNAINACLKIEDEHERMLYIKTENLNQYMIEIANTFTGMVEFDDNGLPKASDSGHGIGTRSIAAFAERNGALLDYSVDEIWFRLRLVAIL